MTVVKRQQTLQHFVVSGCEPHLPSSMTSFVTASEAHL